jgi:hypothetical protein
VTRALALFTALALTACNPLVFEEERDRAPVLRVDAPAGTSVGATGWGGTLAAVSGSLTAADTTTYQSRLLGSGGEGSPLFVFRTFDFDGGFAFDVPARDACAPNAGCSETTGASVAGVPRYGISPLCSITTATSGEVAVFCEDQATQRFSDLPLTGPEPRFGASAVGLRAASHPAGVAFFGALGQSDPVVWRLPDGAGPEPLALTGAAGGPELGAAIGAAAIDGTSVLLAVGGPSTDGPGQTVVARVTADAVEVVACLTDPNGSFGRAVAVGDVGGTDGTPDVVVGVPGTEQVEVFDGATLVATGACENVAPAAVLTCPADNGADIVCAAGANFGTAVTLGDFDGDGDADVAVGAPNATVEQTSGAGAVFVYGGEADLGTLIPTPLRRATATTDQRIGRALTSLPGVDLDGDFQPDRDELVAGANALAYVFLCTGLVGDRPEDFADPDARCQPTP